MSTWMHDTQLIWLDLTWAPGSPSCTAVPGHMTGCDGHLVWATRGETFVYQDSWMTGLIDTILAVGGGEDNSDMGFVWYPTQALVEAVHKDEMADVVCQTCDQGRVKLCPSLAAFIVRS